jgi:hypothetical protein
VVLVSCYRRSPGKSLPRLWSCRWRVTNQGPVCACDFVYGFVPYSTRVTDPLPSHESRIPNNRGKWSSHDFYGSRFRFVSRHVKWVQDRSGKWKRMSPRA